MSTSTSTRSRPGPRRTAPPRRPRQAARRLPLWALAGGVVVLLAVVAVVASGGDETAPPPAPGSAETRSVTVSGAALPVADDGPDRAVGLRAPEAVGAAFDGAPVSIKADGRPKVLVFLAHWCPHCQKEVPVLTQWAEANGLPADVDVIAVSTGTSEDQPNYPPSRWLERERWPFRTLADDDRSSVGAAFGLGGFPFFVVLDGSHTVVARASGELAPPAFERLLVLARGAARTS